MRLIVAECIEKKGESMGVTFDVIYEFVKKNWKSGLEELCSPLSNTIAYKGYMCNLHRIVIFAVSKTGVIYPVYIGDKNDKIAKNITVQVVREFAHIWQKQVERDISGRRIKIRHF